jgi:metal-responsive CopG/Arc/MetJ family transcriptional regulator
MRVKISIRIDEKVLRAIDRVATPTRNRSRIVEDAARELLAPRPRPVREARDLEILNREAAALNAEMEDVLSYQIEV